MENIKSYFIRPQRQTYHLHDLGPSLYFASGIRIRRSDFTVANDTGNILQVSLFENDLEKLSSDCVIYLHTHHGSRIQGLPLVNRILRDGANVCLFDFAGYGNSEGANVTMGSHEKFDIGFIIKQLKKRNQKRFILWGRSMGAVTALLFNQTFPNQIIASIYDSPFSSLEKLTLELAERTSGLPQLFIKPAIQLLKLSLLCQLDFGQLQLGHKVTSIKVPGYFIVSKNDSFLNSQHGQSLYGEYGGAKQLLFIQQDHNQGRKQSDLKLVFVFIKNCFSKSSCKFNQCGNVLVNNLKFQAKQRCKTNYSAKSTSRIPRVFQY